VAPGIDGGAGERVRITEQMEEAEFNRFIASIPSVMPVDIGQL
jgi:hypothetical protein